MTARMATLIVVGGFRRLKTLLNAGIQVYSIELFDITDLKYISVGQRVSTKYRTTSSPTVETTLSNKTVEQEGTIDLHTHVGSEVATSGVLSA